MATPLQAVAAAVAATAQQLAGEAATYARPGGATCAVIVIRAKEMADRAAVAPWYAIDFAPTEWILDADAYPAAPEPQPGDVLTIAPGTPSAKSYRVYAPAGGRCWRWQGPPRRFRRFVTEEIPTQ